MLGHDNGSAHRSSSLHHIFEIVHLKPEQYAIAIWQVVGVPNRTVMVANFDVVQLQDQLSF